jgi:hypothetical protein
MTGLGVAPNGANRAKKRRPEPDGVFLPIHSTKSAFSALLRE